MAAAGRVDVTGAPHEVASMIVNVFGRAMAATREEPTPEGRLAGVEAALAHLTGEITRAIEFRCGVIEARGRALGRCMEDRERDASTIVRLRADGLIGHTLLNVLDSLVGSDGTLELFELGEERAGDRAAFGGAVTMHESSVILDNAHVPALVRAINARIAAS